MAFTSNAEEGGEEIYLDIEGFDEPVHIDDPILEGGPIGGGYGDNEDTANPDTANKVEVNNFL